MIATPLTALVTVAVLIYTFILSGKVGAMRGKSGVAAPATTGDPQFERAFRVHANTIEQLVLFLPLLWLSVAVIGDLWTALIGILWLIGRVIYAGSYMKDPASRGPGMFITIGATGVLALITLYGVVMAFL